MTRIANIHIPGIILSYFHAEREYVYFSPDGVKHDQYYKNLYPPHKNMTTKKTPILESLGR